MDDKQPTPDQAEYNAFFPSPYSLAQFTSRRSDLSGANYPDAQKDGRFRVLMIAADERYLLMKNGRMFSTGNHPVEMLLPLYHIHQAGFAVDIATLSGNPVKLEMWALPNEDQAVMEIYAEYLERLRQPQKLSDVLEQHLGANSPYLGVFIPGGHGMLVGIPHSLEVKRVLEWALERERLIISLCHGPAALLAAAQGQATEEFPFRGYQICVFPDSIDIQAPEMGYLPGPMPWLVGEKLKNLGVEIVNSDITGRTHRDRNLLTGDSPFASNALGQLAARALLEILSALD